MILEIPQTKATKNRAAPDAALFKICTLLNRSYSALQRVCGFPQFCDKSFKSVSSHAVLFVRLSDAFQVGDC